MRVNPNGTGTIADELALRLEERMRMLAASRLLHVKYLAMKVDSEDWGGVAAVASDLREIDAEARAINYAHRGGKL